MVRLTGASVPLAVQRGLPAVAIIVVTVLVAHRLPKADIARWAVLLAIINIARVTADFGLDRSIPRAMTTAEKRGWIVASGVGARLLSGIASGLGLLVIGWLLIGPGPDLIIASAIPAVQAPTVLATAWAIVHSRTSALLIPAALSFVTFVGIVYAATPGLGLVGVLAGMVAGAAIEAGTAWRLSGVVATWAGATLGLGVSVLRDALAFGVQGTLGILYARVPVLILAIVGPDLIVTFSLGYNLYAAVALASSALALTTFARLNLALAQGSRPAFIAATRNFGASAALVVGAAIVIALLADQIVRLLFTATYADAASVARILMLVIPVSICNAFLSVALFSLRADRLVVSFSVAAVAILAILTSLSVPFGAVGPAVAMFLSELAIAVAATAVVIRRLERAF